MIRCLILFILLSAGSVFGQSRDIRGELEIRGWNVSKISVSPDEKIWLMNNGGVSYYTSSIDSNWHYREKIIQPSGAPELSNDLLRVSFFNKDTAIITGFIKASSMDRFYNGYYFTSDGGKSWNIREFTFGSTERTLFVGSGGNAWIQGHGGVYHTGDFCAHWERLNPIPYSSSPRSIFMRTTTEGVATAEHNEIFMTGDGWNSCRKISTPLDQGKYSSTHKEYQDGMKKALLWKNYILVKQYESVFYSDKDSIDWKVFPIKIIDFEIDQVSEQLFAVTDSLSVLSFSTPTKFKVMSNTRLREVPVDMKVVNNSLYIIGGGQSVVYKVNEGTFKRSIPYTTESEVPGLDYVAKGAKNLDWALHRSQIDLKEKGAANWYREDILDVDVVDIKLLDDSTAILWDGIKNNYHYSLRDHRAILYVPRDPLKSFLASPLQSFSIEAYRSGCMGSRTHEVRYERTGDSTFVSTYCEVPRSRSDYRRNKRKQRPFHGKVNGNRLSAALSGINSNPSRIPLLEEFQITKADKKKYLRSVSYKPPVYAQLPAALDTLNPSIIKHLVEQRGYYDLRPAADYFRIRIVNQNNDTLFINRNYYTRFMDKNPQSNLHWKFESKGLSFACYDAAFSKFMNACTPNGFMDKALFSNIIVMRQIANYLYEEKN